MKELPEGAADALSARVRDFLTRAFPTTSFQVSFAEPEEDDAGVIQWLAVDVAYEDGPSHTRLQSLLDEEFALRLQPPAGLHDLVAPAEVSLIALERTVSLRAWAALVITHLEADPEFATRLAEAPDWVSTFELVAGPVGSCNAPDRDLLPESFSRELWSRATVCAGLYDSRALFWGHGLQELARWITSSGLELADAALAAAE